MNITSWDLYWITRLDGLGTMLGVSIGAFALITVICTTAWLESDGDIPFIVPVAAFAALCLSVVAFVATSSTKEMCAILVIPRLAQNEEVQGLGADIIGLAREWVNELKPQTLEGR